VSVEKLGPTAAPNANRPGWRRNRSAARCGRVRTLDTVVTAGRYLYAAGEWQRVAAALLSTVFSVAVGRGVVTGLLGPTGLPTTCPFYRTPAQCERKV
jgi:hypothetical protein